MMKVQVKYVSNSKRFSHDVWRQVGLRIEKSASQSSKQSSGKFINTDQTSEITNLFADKNSQSEITQPH